MIRQLLYALLLIPVLALAGPMSIITGSRYFSSSGGGSPGEWADVYVTANSVGPQLMTDGRVVGVDGTTLSNFLPSISSGNGCTLTFESGGAYDGENSIKLTPPTALVGDNADYCSILTNAAVDNAGAKNVQQVNIRFVAVLGPRYVDLAPSPKWVSFQVATAPGGASANRAAIFDQYVSDPTYAAGRVWAVTADEVQSYHEPEIAECYHPDCGTPAQKGFIVRSTANHSGSPAVAGPNEPIYFEMELDVSQSRGNANGRNRLYIKTRDGLINRTFDIPLNWAPWDFAWDAIINMEGLGWFWNTAGTAHVDNWIRYSHIAISVNRAVNSPIGPPPGFDTSWLMLFAVQWAWLRRMLRKIFAVLLLLFALPVSAAVTVVGTPHTAQGNSATASTSGTIPSGTGIVAYIGVFSGDPPSSMNTFGGVAPVLVSSNNYIYLYRVVSPTPGAATATANLAASRIWTIHVFYVSGVDTADPDDDAVLAENTDLASLPVTVTSAVGDLVIGFGLIVSDTISATDGATMSTSQPSIDGGFTSTGLVYEAGAASVTLGVGSTGTGGDNFIIGLNINAAGGGGGGMIVNPISGRGGLAARPVN